MDLLHLLNQRSMITIVILLLVLSLVNSQLTQTDTNYLKKSLLSLQDEKTGLFSNNLQNTLKAVYSLKFLNEQIPQVPKICRDVSFESLNESNENMFLLNELLACNLEFKNLPTELRDEELTQLASVSLSELFSRVSFVGYRLKGRVNWDLLLDNLRGFFTEGKLLSEINGGKTSSLLSTVKGLKHLTWIHQNGSETVKEETHSLIVEIVKNLQGEFQLIRDDMGLFTEARVSSLQLNSEFADAFTSVRNVVNIENIEELLHKILNYLVTFKYDYYGLENVYYLLRGIEVKN